MLKKCLFNDLFSRPPYAVMISPLRRHAGLLYVKRGQSRTFATLDVAPAIAMDAIGFSTSLFACFGSRHSMTITESALEKSRCTSSARRVSTARWLT